VKLDPLQLVFYTSLFGFAATAAPAAAVEGGRLAVFAVERPATTVQVLLGTSLVAVAYNVVMYQTINCLGAVGSAALGNFKVVLLVLFAGSQMGEMSKWTRFQHLGSVLTFGSSIVYSTCFVERADDRGDERKEHGSGPMRLQGQSRGLPGALAGLGCLGLAGVAVFRLPEPRVRWAAGALLGGRPGKSGSDPCGELQLDRSTGNPTPPADAGELVLVTGGSGFIGSHLVELLLELGYTVRVFDSLETGNLLFLDLRHPRLEFHYGDIMDVPALRRAMVGVRGVFHLGAASKVLPSLKNPAMGTFNVERNSVGTSKVLEVANETGLVGKVMYAASSTYYGNQDVPFVETDPFMPTSPYAASKYMGELAMLTNDALYGMRSLSLRFFMVYGPRNPTEGAYAVVTGKFMVRAREGSPLMIEGSGANFRDFVHVKDVARALALGYQSSIHGTVFNVGSGMTHSVKEVADLISNRQEHVDARRNDLLGTMADTCRAKQLLRFQARHDFVETIRAMMEDMRTGDAEYLAPMWQDPDVVAALEERLPGWGSLAPRERSGMIREALASDAAFLRRALPRSGGRAPSPPRE